MIERIQRSAADIAAIQKLQIQDKDCKEEEFDYSTIIVQKPWGYEYLFYQNLVVAIWMLHIKENHQTSLHCHPNKNTSLLVISGNVECTTLNKVIVLSPRDELIFEMGVFHQSKCVSPGGCSVMEMESPVNKKDLVRLSDCYGREKEGYETAEHYKSFVPSEFKIPRNAPWMDAQ